MDGADAAPRLAGFEDWDPAAYLASYYARLERDEEVTLEFVVEELRRVEHVELALEFGTGPTLHHLLPLVARAGEVHLADYLRSNLDQIRRWMLLLGGSHDWRPFIRHVLACEGVRNPSEHDVRRRECLVRSRVTRYLVGDASRRHAVGASGHRRYDIVLSCYCAECATADKATWRRYLESIMRLLRPGGLFIVAALRRCRSYRVDDRRFPCADIDEHDLAGALRQGGLDMGRTRIDVRAVPGQRALGYESIVLASGFMRPAQPHAVPMSLRPSVAVRVADCRAPACA